MALAPAPDPAPVDVLDTLLDRLAELQGQRNLIDAQIVEVVAELDRDDLWGLTGARSLPQFVAWKTGASPARARSLATVAHRSEEFPACVGALAAGRASLDQVATIAERAPVGTDHHYATLVESATVSQLRTALKLAPREPEPAPPVEPERSVTRLSDDECATWRITLPHVEAAVFDAALQSHLDALVTEWKRAQDEDTAGAPPFPTAADAFLRLVEAGWDADAVARPHGHRTTVVVHLDAASGEGHLHLGPALRETERRLLTCDATVETWLERHGEVIGSGRETRQIGRRLRRALELRDRTCVVPGCGATSGLHGHHLVHWEDGGPTELHNLALVCPFHHRAHHAGAIRIRGPGGRVVVTDSTGRRMPTGPTSRPPSHPPPRGAPYRGPTGQRVDWWCYDPPTTGGRDPAAPNQRGPDHRTPEHRTPEHRTPEHRTPEHRSPEDPGPDHRYN